MAGETGKWGHVNDYRFDADLCRNGVVGLYLLFKLTFELTFGKRRAYDKPPTYPLQK